jgi:DnaK suppressor protein
MRPDTNSYKQSEVMIDARYSQLKEMLEEHRRRLQRSLRVRLHDVRTNKGHDGKVIEALDVAEASDSDLQQDFDIAMAEMAAEALGRVDQALARLASGIYGFCVDCDVRISYKRLTALPFALRCRECEEIKEIGQRRSLRVSAERNDSLLRYSTGSQMGRGERE